MALVKTASLSNKPPSELIGLDDPDIAFAFNMECADVLYQSELDREQEQAKMMIEMTGLGQMTTAIGGTDALVPRGFDASRANRH